MKTFQLLLMHSHQLETCTVFTGKLKTITVAMLINYGCKAPYWCSLSCPS